MSFWDMMLRNTEAARLEAGRTYDTTAHGEADMEVNGLGPIQGPLPVNQSRPASDVAKPAAAKPIATDDQLEISPAGKKLEHLHESSQVRAERLAQIRAAIEAGEYETPAKLEAALDKLLDEIAPDDRK